MTQVTVMDEHERVLDYAYDMLSAGEKASFETHLATCARCQAELAAMGHVREVARAALPMVEPGARLTGVLHAQLMHEASKRKPAGAVLPFLRRVLAYPGYAAAASVLIIGGAVGVQWSRGRLLMPAPEKAAPVAEAQAPVAAPEVAAVTTEAPAAVAPVEKNKVMSPQPVPRGKALDGAAFDKKTSPASATLGKDSARREKLEEADVASAGAPPEPPKRSAAAKEDAPRDGYAQKPKPSTRPVDALDDLIAADERRDRSPGPERKGTSEGQATHGAVGGLGAASQGVAQNAAKAPSRASAPPAPSSVRTVEREQNASPPAAAAAPAPPVQQRPSAGKADAEATYGGGAYGLSRSAGIDTAKAGAAEPLAEERRRAASLARAGRCDEAVALYASIEQRGTLSAAERKSYAGCIRTEQAAASRRQQQAPGKAKSMKAAPVPQNADVDRPAAAEKR